MNTPRDNLPLAIMQRVYATTTRGSDELGQGMTSLSAQQLELLVRIDGVLTLAQIRAGVAHLCDADFHSVVGQLADRRFIALVESSPFAMQLQNQLDNFSLAIGGPAGDAAMLSLRRAGYFVEIARTQAAPPVDLGGRSITALVVEDEPVLAKFVKSYLSFEGIGVRQAANRSEVEAELARRPLPDVVLLDVMLPDINGFDILRQLRRDSAYQQVPVIMLTGKATRESVIEGLTGGAAGYVTKPFQADALVRAVRTVLGLAPVGAPAQPWGHGSVNL